MKLTVIGAGYVGLVTAACMAELGNDVVCLDLDQARVAHLNDGGIPFHEPGLEDLVARNRAAGRLQFSTDIGDSVRHGDVQFIAVGTPADEDGSADLQYVLAAARNIGRYMERLTLVVDKSTVPVGTAEKVTAVIREELALRACDLSFAVASNPEFLKEGSAVEDFMRPDRIVIGCDHTPAGVHARETLRLLYQPFNRQRERTHWMDVRSAEFTKYAANAMLATRISFMNELANLAERLEVDIDMVRRGIGADPRIGPSFLYAGLGYGGSCFPKDVQALQHIARESDQDLLILRAVALVNSRQKLVLGQKIVRRFGHDLQHRHFAIWGLAFKPNTEDMREAPVRDLLRQLLRAGASVAVYDPVAMTEAKRVLAHDLSQDELSRVRFASSANEALPGADALVIVTDWTVFKSPDFDTIKTLLNQPIIFDGRNLFEPEVMAQAGFEYYGIGRCPPTIRQNLM